ncbi:MAG: flagellar hook-basal body complex protein FliE [Syntrophobacterales bacterium]|nr:flagellar hook-basal body complex protein FliE [Syntrophobacterales bacterium]OPX39654.1 MAG: flagellar hook-basal body complex protein FliE [Desulfobacteraceae bacterium 4484_190.3]
MTNMPIRGDLMPPISDSQKESGKVREDDGSFGKILKDKVKEINKLQLDANSAIAKVELGDSGSIHEAVIAMEKASISFKTMLQVRNKILEAYQEVMRMQV